MKNSSNKKFYGKKNNDYKQDSDFGYYSKKKNRSEKSEKFLNNSAKNKNVENLNNNNTFSSLKRRKPIFNSNTEFSNKNLVNDEEFSSKRNFDDWIWGKHSVYEALSSKLLMINRIFIRKFFIRFKYWLISF